jgi:hypothetical protein
MADGQFYNIDTWSYHMKRLIGLSLMLRDLVYFNIFDLSKQPKNRSTERYTVIVFVVEGSAINGNDRLSVTSNGSRIADEF